jgi:4'-phosphopantetheinyl transferase
MIRVLCADISDGAAVYDRLYAQATPERQRRADRCLRQGDRLRCVTADALLRTVLGADTGRIETTESGKPFLPNRENFHFSLSHSGRYVVMAWGETEVGVDVQRQDAANPEAIAARWFAPDEQSYVRGDLLRFYQVWTGKESYLKFTGTGLRGNLRAFSILAPEPGLRYHHRLLEGGYSLSLCTRESHFSFELIDVRQLIT